ncbi:MAG: hypothetical protein H6Q17_2095 [Bacteroidetes bacterium]|nr:hypothetical protein [Bacteroidota bacterium]
MKEMIEQLEHRLAEAIRINDIDLLDKLLHDDLLCVIPGGVTITKAMDMASHRAGDMQVDKLDLTIEEIRIIGDTAIVTTMYDTKGTLLGNPMKGKLKYIRVWKTSDAGLQVIAASCLSL